MALLPVDEARQRLLAGVEPLAAETVPLDQAAGRVLAETLTARLTQPPFPASAMDGYALRGEDALEPGSELLIIGTSSAGHAFNGAIGAGETVRIFTGAPVPEGADAILIQENARREGDTIEVLEPVAAGRNLRLAGLDFKRGDPVLSANRVLDPHAISLAASTGHAALPVRQRPRVAIFSNGDELVPPGATPGADQIVSSNTIGLVALTRNAGADPIDLGIAPDRREAITDFVRRAADADILVVSGGASVGEHDLVQDALKDAGMALDFWRIAMRPGKPLMVGRLGATRVLGLPGNPVSTFVCSELFLKPLIRAMLGLPTAPEIASAKLGAAMGENDGRQDYVRARLSLADGERIVTPFPLQDSSMLSTLAAADALIIRPIAAPPAAAGDRVPILLLGR
jgi:molybdopterin molybdotransferase